MPAIRTASSAAAHRRCCRADRFGRFAHFEHFDDLTDLDYDDGCSCCGGLDSPTPKMYMPAPHGFDFGFASAAAAAAAAAAAPAAPAHPTTSRRAVRQTIADIRLVSSDDYCDADAAAAGLRPPPPRHHRLRAHQSEANLQQKLQQHGASSPYTEPARPMTPPPLPTRSAPTSPVQPRVPRVAASDEEQYFKRGDWKRRGIVFSA